MNYKASRNEIAKYVVERFIATGDYLDVMEVAKHFGTSAAHIHRMLERDFAFSHRDHWIGDPYSGRNGRISIVRPDAYAMREYICKERAREAA